MNNQKLFSGGIALAGALIFLFVAGCREPLTIESYSKSGGGGGSGGGGAAGIPGGGDRTINDIDTSKNNTLGLAGNQPGMRLVQLTQGDVPADEITTHRTLGMWEDGKYHIEGFNTTFNGTFANAGFTDVSLLYYTDPLPEEFTFSARIRIVRAGGVSTGKGVHVGAYQTLAPSAMTVDEATGEEYQEFGAAQRSKGMGLLLRADSTPHFRMYYSDDGASTTAGNTAPQSAQLGDVKLSKEFIYIISREKIDSAQPYYSDATGEYNAQYHFKLLDSKTYDYVTYNTATPPAPTDNITPLTLDSELHPYGTPVKMHPALKGPVYAGVCIMGSVVEISQIKIWDKGRPNWNYKAYYEDVDGNKIFDGGAIGTVPGSSTPIPPPDQPVFRTPDTTPAYVPANFIVTSPSPLTTPNIGNVFREPDGYWPFVFNSAMNWTNIVSNGYKLKITPRLSPDFRDDNIGFEFFPIGAEHAAFELKGADEMIYLNLDKSPMALPSRTYKALEITVDPDALDAAGKTVSQKYKIVARDPVLDLPVEQGGMRDAPEYVQVQTLPEMYIRVQVSKP